MVASRTSPTNMGLALLANLAACDFGYLSVGRLLRRTQDALGAMQSLERHRGHFFNWYDTRTLSPLLPLYVSSVDSGNLAGHLLTLSPGLAELPAQPILAPQVFVGLSDTVGILHELTGACPELERSRRNWQSRLQLCAQDSTCCSGRPPRRRRWPPRSTREPGRN